jgi:hypothetical protein
VKRKFGQGSIIGKPGTDKLYIRYRDNGKRIQEATGSSARAVAEAMLQKRIMEFSGYKKSYNPRRMVMRKQNKSTVYSLIDPRTDQIHYVGVTAYTSEHRLYLHDGMQSQRMFAWFAELKRMRLTPVIKVLEVVIHKDALRAERRWIRTLRECGCRLLNTPKLSS